MLFKRLVFKTSTGYTLYFNPDPSPDSDYSVTDFIFLGMV